MSRNVYDVEPRAHVEVGFNGSQFGLVPLCNHPPPTLHPHAIPRDILLHCFDHCGHYEKNVTVNGLPWRWCVNISPRQIQRNPSSPSRTVSTRKDSHGPSDHFIAVRDVSFILYLRRAPGEHEAMREGLRQGTIHA